MMRESSWFDIERVTFDQMADMLGRNVAEALVWKQMTRSRINAGVLPPICGALANSVHRTLMFKEGTQ